jgi:hypothetical protein
VALARPGLYAAPDHVTTSAGPSPGSSSRSVANAASILPNPSRAVPSVTRAAPAGSFVPDNSDDSAAAAAARDASNRTNAASATANRRTIFITLSPPHPHNQLVTRPTFYFDDFSSSVRR